MSLTELSARQLAALPDRQLLEAVVILPDDLRDELLLSLEPGRQYLALRFDLPATHYPDRDERLENAAGRGDLETVQLIIQEGDVDLSTALQLAVAAGHLDVVTYLAPRVIKWYPAELTDLTPGMLDRLLALFPNDVSELAGAGMREAAAQADQHWFQLLLPLADPESIQAAGVAAVSNNRLDFIKWMNSVPEIVEHLYFPAIWLAAAEGGSAEMMETVRIMAIENGRKFEDLWECDLLDYEEALAGAARKGNAETCKFLLATAQMFELEDLETAATAAMESKANWAIESGGKSRALSIVELLLERGNNSELEGELESIIGRCGRAEMLKLVPHPSRETVRSVAVREAATGDTSMVWQLLSQLEKSDEQLVATASLKLIACNRDHGVVKAAEWALNHGASVSESEIEAAVFNLPMLQLLLPNYQGDTSRALNRAMSTVQLGAIPLLLPGAKMRDMHMCSNNDEVVSMLIRYGVNAELVGPVSRGPSMAAFWSAAVVTG